MCKNMGWSTYLTDLHLWKRQKTKDEVLSSVTQECCRLLWASSQIHSTDTQTTPHLQPVSHKNVLMNSQFSPLANACISRMARRDCTFQLCSCVCVRVCAYYLKTVWARSLEHNWNVCFSPFWFSVSSKAVSSQDHMTATVYNYQQGENRLEQPIYRWGSQMREQSAQISWTR